MSSASEGTVADARAMADSPPTAIMVGIFLAAYLSWRPSIDIMFTVSDLCAAAPIEPTTSASCAPAASEPINAIIEGTKTPARPLATSGDLVT